MSDTLATAVTEDKFDATSLHGIPKNPEEEAKLVKEEKDLLLANHLLRKKNEVQFKLETLKMIGDRLFMPFENTGLKETTSLNGQLEQLKQIVKETPFDPSTFRQKASISLWSARSYANNLLNVSKLLSQVETKSVEERNIPELYTVLFGINANWERSILQLHGLPIQSEIYVVQTDPDKDCIRELFYGLIKKIQTSLWAFHEMKRDVTFEANELKALTEN